MKILKQVPIVLALVVVALICITRIAPKTTSVENNEKLIEQIDGEISTVLKLTGAAAGASAVISLLPDDQCTPIANELAETAKYFLVVLSALYLEKYLVSVMGYVAFSFVIPIGCVLWGIGYFAKRKGMCVISYKLAVFALAIYFLIPLSTNVSQYIYNHYETSIESTLNEVDKITISETKDDATAVEKFKNWIENAAVTATEYVTKLLSDFVDALAVMLVTSCLIPMLIVLFFTWFMKILFGIQVPVYPRPVKQKSEDDSAVFS